MFSCALAVCSALTAKACGWFGPNQAQALAASQTRKVLTSRAQFEGAPSFENTGRRKFQNNDDLRRVTGASASKSGELAMRSWVLLLYQCYSHLLEWLVLAE
jgi:hypothetical protein